MICAHCKQTIVFCEYPGCQEGEEGHRAEAEYEAWVGHDRMLKLRLCPEHVKKSRAYEARGEAALTEGEEPS